MRELPEHVAANRAYWDGCADQWVASGERAWARSEPTWGIWGIPESQLALLPADMTGRDAVELGCGTGYVSAWMVRRGARVVAIDNSEQQLATARRLQARHELAFELIHGNAEAVPRPDGSFDFAISEYGAAIWCDPRVWIPEAHRLLRPGGELVFLASSTLAALCYTEDGSGLSDRLARGYFELERLDWRDAPVDPGGIEFHLPFGAWLRLFRDTGFDVLDLIELKAPETAAEPRFGVSPEWASRFPCEQVWKLKRR